MALPRITPEIPTLVPPFHRDGWVYEEKVDGWRIVAYRDGTDIALRSLTGGDHAARFPDVVRAIAALRPKTLILDGEVAVFDERLISRFDLLQGATDTLVTSPVLVAFDCLYLNGKDLGPWPPTASPSAAATSTSVRRGRQRAPRSRCSSSDSTTC